MHIWSCNILIIFVTVLCSFVNIAYGAAQYKVGKNPLDKDYQVGQDDEEYKYKAETTQVQVNKQTDLFEKSVGNLQEYQQQINDGKPDLNPSSANNLDFIVGGGVNAAKDKANELSTIKATDLNSKGTSELNEWVKETNQDGVAVNKALYVDYSKPLMKPHWDDAKGIAEAQDKLLANLLGELKNLGVDCHTVKGLKEVEPAYYLHVETTQHKDTKYNETLCEELRGTYNCTDTMTMTCLNKSWSILWDSAETFQEKKMILSLSEVQTGGWWYGHYWKKKRYGVYLRSDSWVQQAMRVLIAKKLNVKIGHIHEYIRVEQRGNGDPSHNIQEKHYAWGSYNVWYRFRAGEAICLKWSDERWDERCIQK